MSADIVSIPDPDTGSELNDQPPEIRRLTDDEIASIISAEIADCETFKASGVASEQSEAIRYYYGRPFGNEISGRSSVILTDVRDTIEWILPTLMRMFLGGRQVVRYIPQGPEDQDWAKQATDYAQYITRRGNCGFTVFHDWFKDALLEKLGAVVVYQEEKTLRELERYADLSEEQLDLLLQDEDVDLVALEESTVVDQQTDPETGEPTPLEMTLYEAHIRRNKPQTRIKIEGIPQEEFLVASRVRRIDDDCPFVGRRLKVTKSDLVAMGFKPSFIDTLPTSDSHEFEEQVIERRQDENLSEGAITDRIDWASQELWLAEVWIRIDEDGDGYAELRRILCAGDSAVKILEDDEVNHIPIAVLCPIPMPHKLYGLSIADALRDLQLIRSTLLRQMMDNIYLQNNSRVGVVEGEVEIEDLLTSSPGGVVRMTQPGMIEPLIVQPLGPGAFNLLEYLHGVKEDRTGITRYNQGRDATSLNQTATGISAIMEAANLRIEMLARIFAETGVTRLFEQLLYVMRESQTRAEVIRIRDEWVEMDPRMWDANLDVEVEVGLGTSQTAVRVDNLMLLWDLQKQVLEQDARMVTPENVYAILERIPEAMGFAVEGLFFSEPDPEQPLPEEPDPKLIEAQAKQADSQLKAQIEMETLKFRREQLALDAQLRREEMATRIKVAEIQGQYTIGQAMVQAEEQPRGNGSSPA